SGARGQARVRRALQLQLALLAGPRPGTVSDGGPGAEDQPQGRRDLFPRDCPEEQARRGLPGSLEVVPRLPEVLPGRSGFRGHELSAGRDSVREPPVRGSGDRVRAYRLQLSEERKI